MSLSKTYSDLLINNRRVCEILLKKLLLDLKLIHTNETKLLKFENSPILMLHRFNYTLHESFERLPFKKIKERKVLPKNLKRISSYIFTVNNCALPCLRYQSLAKCGGFDSKPNQSSSDTNVQDIFDDDDHNNRSRRSPFSTVKVYPEYSIPYTTLRKDRWGVNRLKLSSIAYFEVSFYKGPGSESSSSWTENNNGDVLNINVKKLSFGIGNSLMNFRRVRNGSDGNSFAYYQQGRILHNNISFTTSQDYSYSRFQLNDVMGCGVIYPSFKQPTDLCSNHGQIFFTRNGRVIYQGELSRKDILCDNWYPFAVHGTGIEARFNFGRTDSFLFDIEAFEQSICKQSNYDVGQVYDQLVEQQQETLRHESKAALFIHALWRLRHISDAHSNANTISRTGEEECTVGNPLISSDAMITQHIVDSGSSTNNSALDASCESENDRVIRAQQTYSDGMMTSFVRKQSFLQSPYSKKYVHGCRSASLGNGSLEFGAVTVYSRSLDAVEDNEHDCEDSMAVELSSVDSCAVNDLKEFGISIKNPLPTINFQAKHTNSLTTNSSPRQPLQLNNNFAAPVNNGIQFNFSVPVEQSVSISPFKSENNNESMRFANTAESTVNANTGYNSNSENSVATSLCVEVASIGEDGSYIGYGRSSALEFDEEESQHGNKNFDYDVMVANNFLDYDASDNASYASCYARWQDMQKDDRSQSFVDTHSYSNLRHQLSVSSQERTHCSEYSASRRKALKRKRTESFGSQNSCRLKKEKKLCEGQTTATYQELPERLISASVSRDSLSASNQSSANNRKSDGCHEDQHFEHDIEGYDGASETARQEVCNDDDYCIEMSIGKESVGLPLDHIYLQESLQRATAPSNTSSEKSFGRNVIEKSRHRVKRLRKTMNDCNPRQF